MLVASAVMIALRNGPVDRSPVIALVGLFPFLAVPLAMAALLALGSRSLPLRLATAGVAGLFLFTVNPLDAVVGCGPRTSDDQINLLTANLLHNDGTTPDALAATVNQYRPDIIVLEEVTWDFYTTLRDDPSMAWMAYRSTDVDGAPTGTLVWSRWPISQVTIERWAETKRPTVTIDAPQGRFDVSGIHVTAPAVQENVSAWLAQYEALATLDTSRPRLLAGDFNATDDHRPLRELLDQGWTDVHDNKGCGLGTTWPAKGLPVPVYRLDHVLMTDHFEPLSVELLDPKGSDHLPVLASFRLVEGTNP